MKNNSETKGKRAQVTIFVIIAILLVAGIVAYFILRGEIFKTQIPQELNPVYSYFLSCVDDETRQAALILGSRGGYIETPDFEAGSVFSPFSSQLAFLGTPVPYWYYVSGNGIVREQVPLKSDMEKQIEKYLEKEILACDRGFETFRQQGYIVEMGEKVEAIDVTIKDNSISVNLDMNLEIKFGDISAAQKKHKVEVESRVGKFYDLAKKIYDKEQKTLFLEQYSIDVLRLYAPVDGIEISCSPKIWFQENIRNKLKQALEGNVQAIKIKGSYYTLTDPDHKYFVQDLTGEQIGSQGENINFLYSRDWPTKIEIYPDDEPLIAEPVGIQQGLGVLGFCYVPYHFVYDIYYPVLIQIYDNTEIFQFPLAVIIKGNLPRKSLEAGAVMDAEPELCKYNIQDIKVYTYNTDLDGVEANIDFECLGQRCDIGETKLTQEGYAGLDALFPQCLNGYISAEAKGYAKKRFLFSTNQGGEVDIILDRLYNLSVDLQVDSKTAQDFAIISFVSQQHSRTIAWPEQKSVELAEGAYNVSVYVYKSGNINIPGMKKEYCVDVPKSGLLGFLGITEEKCSAVNIPSQQLSNVISGGGKAEDYFTEDMLEKEKMKINVQSIGLPKSLEELQDNYNLIEIQGVYVEFEK